MRYEEVTIKRVTLDSEKYGEEWIVEITNYGYYSEVAEYWLFAKDYAIKQSMVATAVHDSIAFLKKMIENGYIDQCIDNYYTEVIKEGEY